jgi:hypothetical protein
LLGWYLDDIIVFLLRTLYRLIRDRDTRTWPTVEGEVHTSAEDYAKRFIPKWKVTIRYSADDPDKSFVSVHDQAAPPVWATR